MPSTSAPSTPRPGPHAQIHTIRSLTGADLYPPSSPPSPSTPEKRYSRQNLLIFRTATGEERPLRGIDSATDDDQPICKPRISSVTDSSSHASPEHTQTDMDNVPLRRSLPDVEVTPLGPVDDDDDDCGSTYSHASAINLDDLEDDDLAGLDVHDFETGSDAPPIISRQVLEIRRQSFANSFAKARKAKNRRAVVLARPELQPHNQSLSLMERCVHALTEVLDMNLVYAKVATERFQAFGSLYTREERQVITEMFREAGTRLRNETATPWRSPLWGGRRAMVRGGMVQSQSANQLSSVFRPWARRQNKTITSDTLIRSVVYGSHVIPGVHSAESILLRMAGEYQREEVNRKASRAERIDIPLSFAMTLTAALATFARLECNASYRRYRSRSASNRRSNPQALIMLKTKYDGLKLSFAVTLHGDSPCTVLFRRPRIFSLRKIDDYATLVTEAKDILSEFKREVVSARD